MDKTTEALLDASVGDFVETSGSKPKSSSSKKPVDGLGGMALPKQEKKPPAGLAGATLAPTTSKKKKKKAGGGGGVGGGGSSAFDQFGAMGGMGGMNPYGGGMGFGAGGGDPFADLMGSGMGAPGGLQGGGHNPWAPGAQTPAAAQQQALAFEQQMKVFNEQMTQMFKDIPAPGPEDQQQAQASMAETIAMLSGQAGGEGATTNPDGSTKSLSAEQAGMKKMIEAMSGAGGTDGGMQSVMDTMLQHLLSKDVLYEPMKEIAQKYPPWLKKHGKKIPDDELARYESQLVKTRAIIAAFEDDAVEHGVIVTLLQEMQAFGNPPDEIMNEMANAKGMTLGANGMPNMWGGALGGGDSGNGDGPKGMGGMGLGKAGGGKGAPGAPGGAPPECVVM